MKKSDTPVKDNFESGRHVPSPSAIDPITRLWRRVMGSSQTEARDSSLMDEFIQSILYLAVGLTPLLFTQRSSELFEFPKMVFVYGLALAALTLLLVKTFRNHRLFLPAGITAISAGLLIAWMIISGMLGLNFYTSLAGYYTRFNGGIASYIAYAILAIALIDQLASAPERKNKILWRLSWAWLTSATIVSIWGILEHFGHDPSCLVLAGNFGADCWVEDVQARVFATFGQPNWLATYLISAIPLGLVMTIHQRGARKLLAAAMTILAYAAFWYTFSRSGWFGLLGALLIFALAIPWKSLRDQKLWLGGIVLCCLVVSATSFNFAALRAETSLSGRGADSSTGSIRLIVWEGALRTIMANPVFGSGPATFAYSFLPHRPDSMNLTTEWNFLYNEAHNQVLNTAATIGIPGLLMWLALFIAPIGYLLAGFKRNINTAKIRNSIAEMRNKSEIRKNAGFAFRYSNLFRISRFIFPRSVDPTREKDFTFSLSIALASGIIGIFISQLFGFAVVMTNLVLFVGLAILAAPYAREMRYSRRRAISILIVFGASTFVACAMLFRYTTAELASTASAGHTFASLTAVSQGTKAVALNPWEPTYRTRLANAYINAARYVDPDENLRQADVQLRMARQLNPHDLIVAKNRAYYYQAMAKLNSAFQESAMRAAEQAVALSPTDADAITILANMYLEFGRNDQALAQLNRLVSVRPVAQSFAMRARAFQRAGNTEGARRDAREALRRNPQNIEYQKLVGELGG
jgi:O-antigen ligase/Flp pilus assembly protein TadD